jgi:hypothetical protein
MDKDVKKLWIDALRSGKYQQGKFALNYQDRFCCLGVLCDLYDQQRCGDTLWYQQENGVKGIGGSLHHLPVPVREWAEIESYDPPVIYNGRTMVISDLNDHEKLSFEELANIIEQQGDHF